MQVGHSLECCYSMNNLTKNMKNTKKSDNIWLLSQAWFISCVIFEHPGFAKASTSKWGMNPKLNNIWAFGDLLLITSWLPFVSPAANVEMKSSGKHLTLRSDRRFKVWLNVWHWIILREGTKTGVESQAILRETILQESNVIETSVFLPILFQAYLEWHGRQIS